MRARQHIPPRRPDGIIGRNTSSRRSPSDPDTTSRRYERLEKPMASSEAFESIESDKYSDSNSDCDSDSNSDGDGDGDPSISFPSLDDHPELFSEVRPWVDFHTTHNRCEELWDKGRLGDNPDILYNKITEVDQIRSLGESRV
jgi:hypothetical protein